MSEINENSGENVNNLVPEENNAPVLNETVTEPKEIKVTDPQEPEVKQTAVEQTESKQTDSTQSGNKPVSKTPFNKNSDKAYSDKPSNRSGENRGYQNKRERPKGDTIYSDARSLAVKILTRVERTDAYLDKLIDFEIRTEQLNDYDKSLLNEICHGVIRWMRRLDWFLNGFYRGNWEKCTPEVKNTLRVALYQILFLNKIPDFAAVNEAVEFVKRISTQKHADVVNGLLRTIIRTKNDLVYPTREIDEVKYLGIMQSHPNWMVRRWIARFGFDDAALLAESNNKRPILTLRINTLKASKEEIFKRFDERSIVYRTCRYIDYFVTLRLMSKIYLDEDFKDGKYTVQDESAGLPAVLLKPTENDMILDMCAAPGGKSTHIAQLLGGKGKVYSVDKFDAKIKMMKQNAERLGITNIEFIQDDAADLQDERVKDLKFDKILLDAPCSGLGVLSKKPEIRWKREFEDVLALTEIQKNLLNSAVKYLKPGGVIVYSTCSTEQEENMDVVKDFLEKNPEFKIDNASQYVKSELVNTEGCIETFPHRHNIDGSFAARLIKK
ncbi:MAG TPA: 16S rRNA (cytosine(967)-C(5))-methyltransferase RsmB [Ignavibacteria bacterium]|nr:16S rRNA (cytosine(967)-C(5))-methyltransferase RsmB [Bacteroidota bacterium]HRE11568.1 16S rRNA (cytosine(967)-C(5))-methyltransferase RsmB [Ignavibacteria bacterium]HRF65718.1 16S rRNA (cytosine(967)-C(5))-methyltransferase RsmB [Ignavibacteria bacterium]HRJ05245.1 16S rRNA (cytosine(967)-C(5))-methyltransferase RsmB [Ignavibacteria bacterium]HRJ85474.1 16S rRNA (cytosine(967)-C(5))-methyltransferase RsmB [Ignavibacteria bacterium]